MLPVRCHAPSASSASCFGNKHNIVAWFSARYICFHLTGQTKTFHHLSILNYQSGNEKWTIIIKKWVFSCLRSFKVFKDQRTFFTPHPCKHLLTAWMSDSLFTRQTTTVLMYSVLPVLVRLWIKWLLLKWKAGTWGASSQLYTYFIFFKNYFCRFPALWACTWQTVVCLCKLDCSWEGLMFLIVSVAVDGAADINFSSQGFKAVHLFHGPSTNPSVGKLQPAEWIHSDFPARITPQNRSVARGSLGHGKIPRFESRIFFTLKRQENHLSHFS